MDEKSLLRKIFIHEQAYKCINDEEDMKMKIKDMILVVVKFTKNHSSHRTLSPNMGMFNNKQENIATPYENEDLQEITFFVF